MAQATYMVDVPAGLSPGQTFQVQTAAGMTSLMVPQTWVPGQQIQFNAPVAQVVQVAQPIPFVDPRTKPDELPLIQYIFIGGVTVVGGLSSWCGLCVNLCCLPNPTEREKEAMWYTNVTAMINFVHLAVLVVCFVIPSLAGDDLWWMIFIGIHANALCMCFTNLMMFVLLWLNDQRVERRQTQERMAAFGGAAPAALPIGSSTVVGMPVQTNEAKAP